MSLRSRCLFRILSVSSTHDGSRILDWGPTYATRNGDQVPEHAAFFSATPSGSGQLTIDPKAPWHALADPGGPLSPGSYVYIDILDPHDVSDVASDQEIGRTDWLVARVMLYGSGSIQPTLEARTVRWQAPPNPGHDNGANSVFAGRAYAKGSIEMQIDNPGAFAAFDLSKDESGKYQSRAKTLIISRA